MSLLDELVERIGQMKPEEKAELAKLTDDALGRKVWYPTPGPQLQAYESDADILLYGGQAGGGKSGLLIGLALCKHQRSLLMRRQYSDLGALTEDLLKQYGSRKGFNGAPPARLRTGDGRTIEFGAAKDPGDEEHWRGQPHDFLGIDEASQFLESQVRFLMGWVRTDVPGQRSRVVLATNPPTDPASGQWLIDMFAPWLDETFHKPAKPGELRWCVSDEEGNDKWVDGPEPVRVGDRMHQPLSRTFIPAELKDNPFLSGGNYQAQLDSLPEPLRSAVRDGNWMIAHEDDARQVIPTAWVLAAQKRWTSEPPKNAPMCSLGVDVAQGGSAQTVLSPRYDWWFGPLITAPGKDTPLGGDVAALIFKHIRNNAIVVVDTGGGYGLGAYEHLKANNLPVVGFKGAGASSSRTKDRQLAFYNKRAESWWRLREALDPDQPGGSPIALPYDSELVADLTSVRYEIAPRGIKCEDKDEVVKRLGRSPDKGDAVVMAWSEGATTATHHQVWKNAIKTQHRPQVNRGHGNKRR